MRADCGSLAVYFMWYVASYFVVQHLLDCSDHLSILLAWGVLCLNVCLQIRLCLYVSCSRYVCKCARVCLHLHHLCTCACVCECVCVCVCVCEYVYWETERHVGLFHITLYAESPMCLSLCLFLSLSLSFCLCPHHIWINHVTHK